MVEGCRDRKMPSVQTGRKNKIVYYYNAGISKYEERTVKAQVLVINGEVSN